ncbi:MAG: hypothetical protein D6E12_03415 [Desulfovibrio sp.]|nr:MAG: hypothetical protein D6E12_03415 [Desulfovibrio sp.]
MQPEKISISRREEGKGAGQGFDASGAITQQRWLVMKKLFLMVCILAVVGVWGCGQPACHQENFGSDLADWFGVDADAQRKRNSYSNNDDYYSTRNRTFWMEYFDIDDISFGYWGSCPPRRPSLQGQ